MQIFIRVYGIIKFGINMMFDLFIAQFNILKNTSLFIDERKA